MLKKNIYPLVSQTVLSNFSNILKRKVNKKEKQQQYKNLTIAELDNETTFNAVEPIFTPEEVSVLKFLIRTNLFVSLCSCCVLGKKTSLLR